MNNKKLQANMQINVGFVVKGTDLVKNIESQFKQINLSSSLFSGISTGLDKSFKELRGNFDKLFTGLNKRGLSSKQYENMFNAFSDGASKAIKNIKDLGNELTKVFDSSKNQKMLQNLKEQQKILEEISKLRTKYKNASTRSETSARKAKDEFGLDFSNNVTKDLINKIIERRANKQGLSPQQQKTIFGEFNEEELKRIITLFKQYNTQLKTAENTLKEIQQKGDAKGSANNVVNTVKERIENLKLETITQEELNEALEKFAELSNTLDAGMVTMTKNFGSELGTATSNAQDMAEGMATLNEVLRQFGIVLSAGTLVRAFKDIIKQAFDFYKSLDSALNQIYVVSNLSSQAVDNLKTNFINMSKETGMALDDVTTAAVLFYQQGLNTDEVMRMTEVTAQFAKVAGIDATDAADKLTAAVNGYRLSAEDAMGVADKFNKVAAASAADINELSTAFSKAAAQANQAGVSMDNYLAYIATMEEATREAPENLGTSLKTIFSRMQQVNSGESDDGTDINKVETALKTVNIELRDTNGQLRDLEDIFAELGPKWNALDRNTQAYLGTIIAGTRQQSRFITLMQNWDRVLELSEESANSAGQQALMHAKAMESIESKMQQLNVAWQEFISNLGNSGVIKGIIDGLKFLVDLLNDGAKPITVLAAGTAALAGALTKLSAPLGRIGKGIIDAYKNLKNLSSANRATVASYIQHRKQLVSLNSAINKNGKNIDGMNDYIRKLRKEKKELIADNKQETHEYKQNAIAIETAREQVINYRTNQQELLQQKETLMEQLRNERQAYVEVQNSLTTLVASFATASALLPGIAGNFAGMGTGAVMAAKGILSIGDAIGVLGDATAAATAKATAALSIFGGVVTLVLAGVTVAKNVIEAFGKQNEKIAESAQKTADALESYNNSRTTIKSVERLIEKYTELSNKVYLSADEQSKLNDYAQQLADSTDLEVVTDKYGNLSVSIKDVNEKLEELKEKMANAREELIKTELEGIEENDFLSNVSEYYDKYLKGHRSEVRNSVDGLWSTGLSEDAEQAKQISENLKNAIIDDAMETAEAFGGLGIKWTLTEQLETMMESFNSVNISESSWKSLYTQIEILQENIDNLSYDKALANVQGAIKDWGEAAGLTTEQIQIMQNAIMDTLYSNSNLNNVIQKQQSILNKSDPEYYKQQIKDLKKEAKDFYELSNSNWNPFKQDDSEKQYEYTNKRIKLLEKEQEAYKKFKLAEKSIEEEKTTGQGSRILWQGEYKDAEEVYKLIKEKYHFLSEEEQKNKTELLKTLKALDDQTAAFLNQAGLLNEDFFDVLLGWNQDGTLQKVLAGFAQGEGAKVLTDTLIEMINNTDDPDLKKTLEEKLSNVINNIEVKGRMTWTELSDSLDSVSEDLRNMNTLLSDFNETGGFTLETFSDLAKMLEKLNIEDVFNADKLDEFVWAIENLELGFDASTGVITANGEALQTLGEIQEAVTKQKLKDMANSLEADKAELQATIYGIEAEIAANNKLIDYLKTKTGTKVKLSEIESIGQGNYIGAMQTAATESAKLYQDMTSQSKSWAEASIRNAAVFGDAIKKALTGQLGTANVNDYLKGLTNELKYTSTGSYGKLSLLADNKNMVDANAAIAALESYNATGSNTIKDLYSQMKGIEQMQSLLRKMSEADLSKLGTDKDKTKEIEKYIFQLKEIYNILNRIQMLEHRLSMLDSYADVATEKLYGDLLQERLSYNEELLDQYKFLTDERKKQTNGYKEFIQSVTGLEGVFDFDKYGQIIINFEKYRALQDEAIDGETTMKEKADDVYETYTKMLEEVQDYLSTTIDYYKAVIKIGQEMVDSYVEMQDKAADAVKEIYQKILDTKLDAIDKEKEAIEELREARARVNKETKDSKEVAGIQSDIQRAMMDTSGASATALIKAQGNLDDKLDAIAEDKYSEMLDNIIQRLDEEKESLQQEFDEMFDDLTWLFTWLDSDIMNDYASLEMILMQTQDWREKSELERMAEISDWKTKFETYYDKVLDGSRGIYGIYNKVEQMRKEIKDALDPGVTNSMASRTAEIGQTILSWSNGGSSKVTVTNGSALGGGGNRDYTSGYTPTITSTGSYTYVEGTYTKPGIGAINVPINSNTKYGTFETTDMFGVKYQPDNVGKDHPLSKTGYTAGDYGVTENSSGYDVTNQNLWVDKKTKRLYIWNGTIGKYEYAADLYQRQNGKRNVGQYVPLKEAIKKNGWYRSGGLVGFTGPAWLDGTSTHPEAVLDALQTKHFIDFTNTLDKMYGQTGVTNSSSVTIDNISFNVESMSSPEDGEKAFAAFVNKFNEIGSQTGIKFNTFKNTL